MIASKESVIIFIKLLNSEFAIINSYELLLFPFFAIIPIFKVNFVLCFTMIVYSSASFSINSLTIFIVSFILLAIDLCMMIYSKDGLSLVGFISKTKTIGTKPGMSETVEEDWFDQ